MDKALVSRIEELIMYVILLYEHNDIVTAGFYASSIIDICVDEKIDKDDTYKNRIDRSDQFDYQQKKLLKSCVTLRNTVIHRHICNDSIVDLINDLANKLCNIFKIDRNAIISSNDYEDLKRLRNKYTAAGSSTKINTGNKIMLFSGFVENDFRNLVDLRKKMHLLACSLSGFCSNLKPVLNFDSISNSVTAFVWLAAVKNNIKYERPKIEYPSLSILATNRDFRVYLDFGGRCIKERKKYYKYILSDDGMNYLNSLDGDFTIFDIYWYHNVENRMSIQTFYEKRYFANKLILRDELKQNLESFESGIDRAITVHDNKILIGKIYDSKYVVERGKKIVDDIKVTFTKLMPIYAEITK